MLALKTGRVLFGEVKVVVDSSSAALLEGAVLDYKDGLTDAGFSITNPNAQRTCGCGPELQLRVCRRWRPLWSSP